MANNEPTVPTSSAKPASGTTLEDFIRRVNVGNENALQISQHLLSDGTKCVVLDLQNRRLQDEPPLDPKRSESPRRAHTFHAAAGFSDYIRAYKSDHTVILADVHGQTVSAIINERAEKGFEIIRLTPVVHPSFAPWAGLLGKKVTIEEFSEFVLANRRVINNPMGKELAMIFSQVRAATSVTLQQGRGTARRAVNGLVVETVIQSERTAELVDLPDTVSIYVPLYVGTDPVCLEIDLTVSVVSVGNEQRVVVTCTSADLIEKRTQAFESIVAGLSAIEGVTVAMGVPDHDEWDYLGE